MINAVQITAIIGLLLSIYSLYVENKARKNPSYKSVCDIHEKASCTKAFTSQYGSLAGISNAIIGIILYIIVLALSIFLEKFVFYLAILAVIGSIYLAYLQYIKMRNFCLVCTGIYIVNILLLIFSYLAAY